ncbi:MAG: hypothetical protein ABI305_09880 [Tepidiformaceae bacterium]
MSTFLRSVSALLAVGLITAFAWGSSVAVTRAEPPPSTFVIELSASGFNPRTCKISRGDLVFFRNVDSKPHHVIWADPGPGGELHDTGQLAPGATSTFALADFNYPSNWVFQDADNLAHKVVVFTPTLSNSWTPDCTPSADSGPPTQLTCDTAVACVRVPSLAADK